MGENSLFWKQVQLQKYISFPDLFPVFAICYTIPYPMFFLISEPPIFAGTHTILGITLTPASN